MCVKISSKYVHFSGVNCIEMLNAPKLSLLSVNQTNFEVSVSLTGVSTSPVLWNFLLNLKLKIVFFKEQGKISVFLSHHPSHFIVCTKSYSPQKHFHITHCTKKNGMLDSILFRIKYIFVPDSEWKLKGSPHSKESKQSQGEWGEQV